MLTPEVIDQMRTQVRCGFYDKDRLLAIFCEEKYAPGELSPDEVSEAIDRELELLRAEQESWAPETDCDRLDRAFQAMNERGLIALQNAGFTQSDGYEEVSEAYIDIEDEDQIIGYCYYHSQDLEYAVRGDGLHLSFGPANPEDEETKGLIVGRLICEELQRVGLEVEWNGTFKDRIFIPKILWQRRIVND